MVFFLLVCILPSIFIVEYCFKWCVLLQLNLNVLRIRIHQRFLSTLVEVLAFVFTVGTESFLLLIYAILLVSF